MGLGTPFLTLLDPRAKIKGSRDPLGLQPVWTRFGREVIHNLTTVTTSLREFTVLLLGLFFAEEAVEVRGAHEAEFASLFLKFEQLAAYSRYAWRNQTGDNESDIRGIRRVKRNFNEGEGRVRISADQEHQILSNQRTYGIWGLYTVAARNSSWLEPGSSRLNSEARAFIEQTYLPRLDRAGASVFPFLTKDQPFEPRGKKELGHSLARVLGPQVTEDEKAFYSEHLLSRPRPPARSGEQAEENAYSIQWALWEHVRQVNRPGAFRSHEPFCMAELREIIKRCQAGGDERLVVRLEHIHQVESVIGPAGRLFGFVLSRDGQTIEKIASEVRSAWGERLHHLDPDAFAEALSGVNGGIAEETRHRLSQLARALADGSYVRALELLLEQNEAVMKERGGNVWVRLKGRERQIDVRFGEETAELPPATDLPDLWTNTYFINSLKSIGFQIESGGGDDR